MRATLLRLFGTEQEHEGPLALTLALSPTLTLSPTLALTLSLTLTLTQEYEERALPDAWRAALCRAAALAASRGGEHGLAASTRHEQLLAAPSAGVGGGGAGAGVQPTAAHTVAATAPTLNRLPSP